MCKVNRTLPHPQNLKLLSFNVENLEPKLDEASFVDLIYEHDICVLTETWKKDETKLGLPGFWDISQCRPKHKKAWRHSGGISVLVKDEIRPCVKVIDNTEGFIWIKLNKSVVQKGEDIIICAAYIPPQYTSKNVNNKTDYYQSFINGLLKHWTKGKIIVAGDLNSRVGVDLPCANDSPHIDSLLPPKPNADIKPRSSCDQVVNAYGRKLNEVCQSFNLSIANGRIPGDRLGNFTCYNSRGCSTVDYIICDNSLISNITQMKILPPDFHSIHSPISVVLDCDRTLPHKEQPLSNHPPKLIWDPQKEETFVGLLKHPHTQEKINLLNSCINQPNVTKLNLDLAIKSLTDILMDNASKCMILAKRKKKVNKIKKKPWYGKECLELKKRLTNVSKLLMKKPHDPHIRGSFIKVKREYTKMLKQSKRHYDTEEVKYLGKLTGSPKQFWKHLKKINNTNKESNCPISSSKWIEHFSLLNTQQPPQDCTQTHTISDKVSKILNDSPIHTPCSTLDRCFTVDDIAHGIKRLNSGKASGLDSINNEIIKAAAPTIAPMICSLFNKLFELEHFPVQWAVSLLTPLYKCGETCDPNNYRGITLNSCLSKFFTLLLNDRLVQFCEQEQKIHFNQIGFRKGFRTADHVFTIKTLIEQAFSNKKSLYVCFIDFKKAYDTVWRDGLFYKLLNNGVSVKFTKLIKDMYSQLRCCVSLPNGISLPFASLIGLKQGCNLSPTLFNIFINDLVDKLDPILCHSPCLNGLYVNCLLYADDVVIISESKEGLQQALDKVSEFCYAWHLKVNYTKTKCMEFTRAKRKQDVPFTIGDIHLTSCQSYCYLGTLFAQNGSLRLASEDLNEKAKKAMFSIIKNLYKNKACDIPIMFSLFDKMILPIASYNSEVWGVNLLPPNPNNNELLSEKQLQKNIERLHLKYLKLVLGVKTRASNWACLSEAGRYPISIRVYTAIMKYLLHLVSTSSPLLSAALVTSQKLCEIGYNSWYKSALRLIKYCGMEHILYTTDRIEIQYQISQSKWVLKDKFKTLWKVLHQNHQNSGKLQFFSSLKESFGTSSHLLNCKSFNLRKSITKLRISDHIFPIEVGRYEQTSKNNRICSLCCDDIGNEQHYLLECNHLHLCNIRDPLIQKLTTLCPNLCNLDNKEKCKHILNCKNEKQSYLTGQLCHMIMEAYKVLAL